MLKLQYVAENLEISRMEAIGYLYFRGIPVDISNFPYTSVSEMQYKVLFQHYVMSETEDKPRLYNNGWLLGVVSYYNKDYHYGGLLTSTYQITDKVIPFNGTDYYYDCKEDDFFNAQQLLVFRIVEVKGYKVAVDIHKYNSEEHKGLAISRILHSNFINKGRKDEINFYKLSGLKIYDLLYEICKRCGSKRKDLGTFFFINLEKIFDLYG